MSFPVGRYTFSPLSVVHEQAIGQRKKNIDRQFIAGFIAQRGEEGTYIFACMIRVLYGNCSKENLLTWF
jgi:hypothetical protein